MLASTAILHLPFFGRPRVVDLDERDYSRSVEPESDLVKAYRVGVKHAKEIPPGDHVDWLLTKLPSEDAETIRATRRVLNDRYERRVLTEALRRLFEEDRP